MANDPKYIRGIAAQLKLEASYLASGSPAATDVILLDQDDPPEVPVQYVNDGERPGSPGSGGARRLIAPSGPFIQGLELTIAARGAGAAYSASVLPRDAHVGMLMSGHSAAIDTTGGAEQVTYTPSSGPANGGVFSSAVAKIFSEQEMSKLKGVLATFRASMKNDGDVLKKMFSLSGMVESLPADTALGTQTYLDETLDPMKADSVPMTITPSGGSAFTPKWRSWEFDPQRQVLGPFFNPNDGTVYFRLSPSRKPKVTLTFEKVDAATFDPVALRSTKTTCAMVFSLTGPNYNKMDFSGARAQLISVKPAKEDPLALWDTEWRLYPSAFAADNDYSFIYKK